MSEIIQGDCLEVLKTLPNSLAHTCVTSPPYWGLRDYGVDGQIGLEASPEEYVDKMVQVFREVRRVLRDDGTLWLNLGDSYAGSGKGFGGVDHGKLGEHANEFLAKPTDVPSWLKPKDLVGIPWRVAFALQADGWYLRSDCIWHKPNAMPESVKDRPTKAHEYIFLLSKSERYYYDAESIAEDITESSIQRLSQSGLDNQQGSNRVPGKTNGPMKAVRPRFGVIKYGDNQDEMHRTKSGNEWTGESGKRNKRTVWTVATQPFKEAHFATFPEKLIEPCILAGCPEGGIALDPFFGTGTVGRVAMKYGREFIGIELNPDYIEIEKGRLSNVQARMTLTDAMEVAAE